MSKKWRKAVKKAMQNAAAAESNSTHKTSKTSFNYRWEHVSTVATLALKLAELVGADKDVVEAAAWLHDIHKQEGQTHAKSGASFARDFLSKTDFPKKKIKRVASAISEHKGLWRDEPLTDLESKVLWDADKLSKLGLTAAFHWTGLALAGKRLTSVDNLITIGRSAEWQKKTVASMHTKPAKRAAKKRIKAFNKLWKNLQAELDGDDLKPRKKK
jgi:uncharacterized protein